MFGFLIGTACLIGLIKVLRGGRGYGYGGCGGYGPAARFGGGSQPFRETKLQSIGHEPPSDRELTSSARSATTFTSSAAVTGSTG